MAIEIKNKKEEQAREELTLLIQRYPVLSGIEENIWQAFSMMRDSYDKGGKLLLCGNGGSSADTDHIVGELMKAFCSKRPLAPELLSNVKKLFGERRPLTSKSIWSRDCLPFPSAVKPPCTLPLATTRTKRCFMPSVSLATVSRRICSFASALPEMPKMFLMR